MAKSSVSCSDPFQQTYHQRIKSRRKTDPRLTFLDNFLDRAIQFLPASEKKSRFDIEVVHILESGAVHGPVSCNDKKDFDQAIGLGAPKDRIGTVILVEDILYDVIEHLGITYNIPPEFFVLHLRNTEDYQTGIYIPTHSPEIELLSSYFANAPFYSLQLQRYYPLPGGVEELHMLRKTKTNVPRSSQTIEGFPNSPVMERVTTLTAKDDNGKDIGILLTDRLLKKGTPLGHAYPMTSDDLLEGTLAHAPFNSNLDRSLQVPLRTEVILYLLRLPPSTTRNLFSPKNAPLFLSPPLIQAMACFAAMLLADVRTAIRRISQPQCTEFLPNNPEFVVYISRRLRQILETHRRELEVNMRIIRVRAPDLADELNTDIESLAAEMSLLLTRLENDVQFLASNLSVQQARLVNVLANVGILFVPVSTVAAVLSVPDSRGRFVVFGAVTVPVILVLSFWLFALNKRKLELGGMWSAKIR